MKQNATYDFEIYVWHLALVRSAKVGEAYGAALLFQGLFAVRVVCLIIGSRLHEIRSVHVARFNGVRFFEMLVDVLVVHLGRALL